LTAHLANPFGAGLGVIMHGADASRLHTNLCVVCHLALIANALIRCTRVAVRAVSRCVAAGSSITTEAAITISGEARTIVPARSTVRLFGQTLTVAAIKTGGTMPIGRALCSTFRCVQTGKVIGAGRNHTAHVASAHGIAGTSLSQQIAAARRGQTLNARHRIDRLAPIGRAMVYIAWIRSRAILNFPTVRTRPIGADLGGRPQQSIARGGCTGGRIRCRDTLIRRGTDFIGTDFAIITV